MSTELDRLKAWMDEMEYTISRMALKMNYSYNLVWRIVTGNRPISEPFKRLFTTRFGADVAAKLFDATPTRKKRISINPPSVEGDREQRLLARLAVTKAIKDGKLLPAKNHICHGCTRHARDWHHSSYRMADWLCVVPLCRECHINHHSGKRPLTFGVVPTHVGLIRIAVAIHGA